MTSNAAPIRRVVIDPDAHDTRKDARRGYAARRKRRGA